MKLFLLSDLYQTADRWHAATLWVAAQVQKVRVWAWTAATKEDAKTCNTRKAAQTRLC
jgi:hypothetical protein